MSKLFCRSGEERRGQQTRREDDELKHNNQHYVGMNGSPPFSNVEDEGQLQGQMTRRTMDNNKDNGLQQGQRTRPTN